MSGRICPFNAGRHKFLVTEWGQSCRYCHKTWEWRPGGLFPTYPQSGFQNPNP